MLTKCHSIGGVRASAFRCLLYSVYEQKSICIHIPLAIAIVWCMQLVRNPPNRKQSECILRLPMSCIMSGTKCGHIVFRANAQHIDIPSIEHRINKSHMITLFRNYMSFKTWGIWLSVRPFARQEKHTAANKNPSNDHNENASLMISPCNPKINPSNDIFDSAVCVRVRSRAHDIARFARYEYSPSLSITTTTIMKYTVHTHTHLVSEANGLAQSHAPFPSSK